MDNTLNKNLILKNKKDIQRLFRSGIWKRGQYMNLVSCKGNDLKILFTTSRYVKFARTRNLYKRHLRELVRKNKDLFPEDTHYGLVLNNLAFVNSETKLLNDLRFLLG